MSALLISVTDIMLNNVMKFLDTRPQIYRAALLTKKKSKESQYLLPIRPGYKWLTFLFVMFSKSYFFVYCFKLP